MPLEYPYLYGTNIPGAGQGSVATVTNGSRIVTGTGGAWTSALEQGDLFLMGGAIGLVEEIISDTELRLALDWTGTTITDGAYVAMRGIAHTDPRNYGRKLGEYLVRVRELPDPGDIGDVFGPGGGVVNNEIVLFDATTGKQIKASNGVTARARGSLQVDGQLAAGGEFTYGKAKNITGTDLNALTVPGFYDGTNLANAPNDNPEWFYIEVLRHSNNDQYVFQRATALYHSGYATWVRNSVGGVWNPWRQVWDSGNMDPWVMQPIGVPIPVFRHIPGASVPPTNKGYRYVILTAGQTGPGGYNEGILTNETVTGSDPLIYSSAVINLPASPMHGQGIRLINTERRFIRAGMPGEIQDDAMQDHTHWQPRDNILGGGAGGTSASFFNGSVDNSTGGVDNGRVANETRPRNIGATYYMRIL